MTQYSSSINQQYSRQKLVERILDAFKVDGINPDELALDDLSRIDQLHAGGRDGTRNLAKMAALEPGMKVLDVGSGLGGPARTLASEFGCHVMGIDITEDFVKTAEFLTDRFGLSNSVSFSLGNALNLDIRDGTFDCAWSQTTIMNIEDKQRVFQEACRVVRPGGIIALEAIMAGTKEEARFPVLWADTPDVSFLSTSGNFRQMMDGIGFTELEWKDISRQAIRGFLKQQEAMNNSGVGVHILTTDGPRKVENTKKGLADGTYVYIQAVFKRAD